MPSKILSRVGMGLVLLTVAFMGIFAGVVVGSLIWVLVETLITFPMILVALCGFLALTYACGYGYEKFINWLDEESVGENELNDQDAG